MSIQGALRELWPSITGQQLQKVADAIVTVHGPIPTGEDGQPTMTQAAFCEAFLKRSFKDWMKSAIHRARQADDQAAQAAVDTEFGNEVA